MSDERKTTWELSGSKLMGFAEALRVIVGNDDAGITREGLRGGWIGVCRFPETKSEIPGVNDEIWFYWRTKGGDYLSCTYAFTLADLAADDWKVVPEHVCGMW